MMRGEQFLLRCRALTDERLLEELRSSAERERVEVAMVVARLAEMHRRRLAEEGPAPSLFTFCVRELGYCEATAYYRSKAAEAAIRFPKLLDLIESGDLSVPAAALLSKHLTPENFDSLTRRATKKSRREVEAILAGLVPMAKPPESSRIIAVVLPAQSDPATASEEPEAPNQELPLPPRKAVEIRHEHRFTFDEATEEKLGRARALLSHKYPMGDLESIFAAALDALLEEIDPAHRSPRPAKDPRPRDQQTRRVPEWVKRIVRERDGDRCSFVSQQGVRCAERRFVQFDHRRPWALGGTSDDPANIRQLCAAHNRMAARKEGLRPP